MLTLRDHRADGYGLECEALPNSRKAAESIGSAYFFTGRPCLRGHVVSRYTLGGRCSYCTRSAAALKRGSDPDVMPQKVKANMLRRQAKAGGSNSYVPAKPCKQGHNLRWVGSNNCVECGKIAQERRKHDDKKSRYFRLYGLTAEAHEALFLSQGRSCAICETVFTCRRKMHVDHCHASGAVRALLCSQCNQGLGLFKDSSSRLIKAAEYINAHAS